MTPRPMDEPAGWADVALAVVEFAREAPAAFLLTSGVLLAQMIVVLLILYRLLPGTVRELTQLFEAMRKYGKGSRLMDKDDDHAS